MKTFFPTVAVISALVVGACGGGSTPSPTALAAPEPTSPAGMTVDATLMDFKIEPSQLSVSAPFTVAVVNNGPTPHNFTIRDAADTELFTSGDLRRDTMGSVTVPELAPGEYTFFCSLPGHESLGMSGTLTVTP